METVGGGPQRQELTTYEDNSKTNATESDDVDAPELDDHTIARRSASLKSVGEAGGRGGNSVDCPTTGLEKRRRPNLSRQYESEILKRRYSTIICGLQEAVKAAEDWNTILCASLDFSRPGDEELLAQIDAQKKRETLLLEERGELIYKLSLQIEKEELLIQEHKREVHDIELRKKTQTLLLEDYKESWDSTLKETEARRRNTMALLLQVRKELLKRIDAQERTETVLLQEHADTVHGLSKRIRAQKKRELQLLQEVEDGKVKLCEAVDKLRFQRDTESNSAIKILRDVTQKVLDFAVDLEQSQVVDKFGCRTAIPRAKSCRKTPRKCLPSSWEDAKKTINRAETAFSEAAKKWKRSQASIDVMKSYSRQGLLDKVLGRKGKELADSETKKATIWDIQDVEGHPLLKHPKREYNAAESEERPCSSSQLNVQKRVPRIRKKPQRYGFNPSPPRRRITRKSAKQEMP